MADIDVIEKTDELIHSIRSSQEYRTYLRLKRSLAADGEKQAAVNAFREKLFVLQNQKDSTQADLLALKNESASLLADPLVLEYLSGEQALISMVRHIFEKLGELLPDDFK